LIAPIGPLILFQPILGDDMIDQKIVQDAGTHNHLEKYS